MAAWNMEKKQKVLAATGAAVMAVYQTFATSPTVLFPPDDEDNDDLYCTPTSLDEDLDDTACDFQNVVGAAALATVTEVSNKIQGVTADMEDINTAGLRSSCWFRKYLLEVRNEERWMQHVRMTRRSFLCLVKYLEPAFKRETKWKHIAIETKVGATLHRLVTGASFKELGEMFSIDSEVVAEGLVQQTVKALSSELGHLISWPTGVAMEKIIQGFKDTSSLPNCCGAIDGCDILITGSNPNYKNKNGNYTVILQAVCDTQNKFLDVMCGWTGRTLQTQVLNNSKFFERVNRGKVLCGPRVPINAGFWLRQYIVGDSDYPYVPWLMTPYPNGPELIYSHKCFNRNHEQARRHIEEAFNILKSTFRLLGQPIDDDVHFIPHLIFAACIRHNLLIDIREIGTDSVLHERSFPEEDTEESEEADGCEENGATIRDELTEMIVLTT